MSYRKMKLISILIPTLLIGGFEFFRHSALLYRLSMEAGNYLITLITLIISYAYATWMFRTIKKKNTRITNEREMRAIYEERERLAKELHDSIAQTLFLLKVHLKKGKTEEAGSLVNSIDTHLRQAIFNLRMSPTEQINFTARIQNWLEEWNTVSGIEMDVNVNIHDTFFTTTEEIQLFGIIQEAFTNIRKHSNASEVFIRLQTEVTEWELVIADNGIGFNFEDIRSNQYGLRMLKERAERLEAHLDIQTEESKGTKIILRGKK